MELDDLLSQDIQRIWNHVDIAQLVISIIIFISWPFFSIWMVCRYNASRNRLCIFAEFLYPFSAIAAMFVTSGRVVYYGFSELRYFGLGLELGPFLPNPCAALTEAAKGMDDLTPLPCWIDSVGDLWALIRAHASWRTILAHQTFREIAFFVGFSLLPTGLAALSAYSRSWDCAGCKKALVQRLLGPSAILGVLCGVSFDSYRGQKCADCERAEKDEEALIDLKDVDDGSVTESGVVDGALHEREVPTGS